MTNIDLTETVRKMKDRELYAFFSDDQFYGNRELALAVCQEVENREAMRTGRNPAKVVFQEMEDGCRGTTTRDGKVIALNEQYLHKRIARTLFPEMALRTLLHEGRHSWQIQVANNENLECPDQLRMRYQIDFSSYISGNEIDLGMRPDIQARIQYSQQEIEADARYYALKRMTEICEQFQMGDSFEIEIERGITEETEDFYILVNLLTEERYELLELKRLILYDEKKLRQAKQGQYLPDIPDGFRFYENIHMIRHVLIPVFLDLVQMNLQLQEDSFLQKELLFTLYSIAREHIMAGETLESPAALIELVLNDQMIRDFNLSKEKLSREVKRTLRM